MLPEHEVAQPSPVHAGIDWLRTLCPKFTRSAVSTSFFVTLKSSLRLSLPRGFSISARRLIAVSSIQLSSACSCEMPRA